MAIRRRAIGDASVVLRHGRLVETPHQFIRNSIGEELEWQSEGANSVSKVVFKWEIFSKYKIDSTLPL